MSDTSGAEVFVKLENLQLTGSFKLRGALNALSAWSEAGTHKFFTASTGNHGLAMAEAARITGADVTVCIPVTASAYRREALAAYNVGLIRHGKDPGLTESYARRLAAEKNALYVSPYNDPFVIAGQGTVALEMLEEEPGLSVMVVAVGGGGLISGIAVVAKALNPKLRIVGVVAARSPIMKRCVEAGRMMPVFADETIADSIAGSVEADTMTFPIVKELVDDWVAVEEGAIEESIVDFLVNERMVIEGAAAAAVAVCAYSLVRFSPTDRVGLVVCGGNIATDRWQSLLASRMQEKV